MWRRRRFFYRRHFRGDGRVGFLEVEILTEVFQLGDLFFTGLFRSGRLLLMIRRRDSLRDKRGRGLRRSVDDGVRRHLGINGG